MISKKAKYALLALVHLASKQNDGPILISTISSEENIPLKFLEAILLVLKNAGILNSKKGKGGGYYLIKNPEMVSIAMVLRLFDGAIALIPCVSDKFYEKCIECKSEEECSIRDAFQKVRDESDRIFSGYTLKYLIERKNVLKKFSTQG